jgi:hypothetical protein
MHVIGLGRILLFLSDFALGLATIYLMLYGSHWLQANAGRRPVPNFLLEESSGIGMGDVDQSSFSPYEQSWLESFAPGRMFLLGTVLVGANIFIGYIMRIVRMFSF